MSKEKGGWKPLYLMRCMSQEEFDKYKRGEVLRNLSTHQDANTDAIGFCFFPVSSECEPVHKRLRYLSGIVSLDVVVVFATEPGIFLHRATGYYRNPKYDISALRTLEITSDVQIKRTEFCTTVYDKQMLRLVAYGTPYWIESNGWWIQWHKGMEQVRRLEDAEG